MVVAAVAESAPAGEMLVYLPEGQREGLLEDQQGVPAAPGTTGEEEEAPVAVVGGFRTTTV